MNHDTYTWTEGRRWFWRCLTCDLHPGQTYKRRMDADEAAEDHAIAEMRMTALREVEDAGIVGQHAQLDPEARR